MKTFILLCVLMTLPSRASVAQTAQGNTPSHRQEPIQKKEPQSARGLGWIHLFDFQIPPALLKALNQKQEFRGWENSGVYYDAYGDRYSFDITKGDSVNTYFVDATGKPLKEEEKQVDELKPFAVE